MPLIEGLQDAIESDYERLRGEVRAAITESEYTIGQIAVLADIHERTIYRLLAGQPIKIDSFLRLLYVLGIGFEITRPEAAAASPFRVVPLDEQSDQSSSRSRGSSSKSSARNLSARGTASAKKKVAKQAKKPSRRDGQNWKYTHPAADQRERLSAAA